jgi:hypothetical protein
MGDLPGWGRNEPTKQVAVAPHYGGVERDTPASIGGAPHGGTTQHLECQREDVQRLAGMGLMKGERERNGRVMSARGRTTAGVGGPLARDCGEEGR